MDTWDLIAAERARLVDVLAGLDDTVWTKPSLCAGWTNHDALAHIVSTAELTPARFVAGMALSGFRFPHMVARNIARVGTDSTEQLLGRLWAAVSSNDHPPGPVAAMLMEIVVHGEDIMFPLGQQIGHSDDGLLGAADFARSAQPLVGCRKRIAGLRLVATDLEWSTGAGPEVRGYLLPLLLAMSGRKAALDLLTGEGVDILHTRA